MLVECPQCSAQYRIASDFTDKITCTQCTRVFFPKATAGRARRQKSYTGLVLGSVAGLVVVIGIGIAIKGGFGGTPKPVTPVAAPPRVELGWANERVQSVAKFARAIADKNDFDIEQYSILRDVQRHLAIEPEVDVVNADDPTKQRIKRAIFTALFEGEAGAIFRAFEFDGGRLMDASFASSNAGKVYLDGAPRDTKLFVEGKRAAVVFDFVWQAPYARITRWDVVEQPAAKRATRPKDTSTPLESIAAPVLKETMIGDKKVTVKESDVVPLDHLADTPEDKRKEIDALVAQYVDMAAPARQAGQAREALKKIGRPAVPRLLNQFNFFRGETKDEIEAIGRIDRLLRDMTGVAFNYSSAMHSVGQNVGASQNERDSAKRQWFAWWREWHNRDYTYNIDKADDETLLMTEEQLKARQATQPKK